MGEDAPVFELPGVKVGAFVRWSWCVVAAMFLLCRGEAGAGQPNRYAHALWGLSFNLPDGWQGGEKEGNLFFASDVESGLMIIRHDPGVDLEAAREEFANGIVEEAIALRPVKALQQLPGTSGRELAGDLGGTTASGERLMARFAVVRSPRGGVVLVLGFAPEAKFAGVSRRVDGVVTSIEFADGTAAAALPGTGRQPRTGALTGWWLAEVEGKTDLLVFEEPDIVKIGAETSTYTLAPGVIRIASGTGVVEVPYRLDRATLVITMSGRQIPLRRLEDRDVRAIGKIEENHRRLLTFYGWASFSYSGNRMSNSSRSTWSSNRIVFHPDGTYGSSARAEASTWADDGQAGTITRSGAEGRWLLRAGTLFLSRGDGPLEQQDFWVKCNSEHRFQLTASGDLYLLRNGEPRCACAQTGSSSNAPILMINGTEYMINR